MTGPLDYFRLQAPAVWITAGSPSAAGAGLPWAWRARRVCAASFDSLTMPLRWTAQPNGTAVFLDEAFVDHPDFAILGHVPPATAQKYWPSMQRFFRQVEYFTGLRVVVALHPKNSGVLPPEIAERVIACPTAELVRDSDLVIAHASTAVSFAVLFRRPMVFVTTDEIERWAYGRTTIRRMARCFGQRPLNTDRCSKLKLSEVRERLYLRYEHAFIRAPGAATAPAWELIASAHQAR